MLPIRTILHPTDFSKPSEHAFRLAGSLARDHNARLILLHVMPPPMAYGEVVVPQIPPEEYKEKLWEAFHTLEKSDPRVRELRVETKLMEGDAAHEILRVAKETGCELIVMGTHGRTGLPRLLMGSVAEQVVRKATCPVLTVKSALAIERPAEKPEKAREVATV